MSEPNFPMSRTSAMPYLHSRRLPPYRGIVAVDAKDFTGHPAVEHEVISRTIPQVLRESFRRGGLTELWDGQRFPNATGDGYVFGFNPEAMPFVIDPWLGELQNVLTEFRVNSIGTVRLRLRVSLHIGPLPDSGQIHDGNGTPRNDTHRLLDSRPVKAIMAASSESITQVAAILSDRCYQDVVAGGYCGRHPDHFIEVPATVEGKPFEQRAWLYVPAPSGNLYDRRILGADVMADRRTGQPGTSASVDPGEEDQETPGRATPPARTVVRADRGFATSGTVHGGQHLTNTEAARHEDDDR
ncbi:hypothetical protein ACWGIB_11685 [Streptomyces xiamenensis]